MLLLFLPALVAPGPCGAAAAPVLEAACLDAEVRKADAAIDRTVARAPEQIASVAEARSDGEVRAWMASLKDAVRLWRAYRVARCDGALIAYETGRPAAVAAGRCRLRIARAAADDLAFRYDPSKQRPARADVETPGKRAEEKEPCDDAPPRECDYCGINRCFERRLKEDEAELNAAWRRALARIATARRLSAARRADWTGRLRRSQRLWLQWRDANCALERLEAPNPNAHSIFSTVTGPCLTRETEARAALLTRTYGR